MAEHTKEPAHPKFRRQNRLALRYFISALLLFGTGYGAAWASQANLFAGGQDNQPKKDESKPQTATESEKTDGNKPSPKAGREYTVQSGDTISSIAGVNGVSFEALAKHNDIPYPYNLTIGQTVTIPTE